MLPSLKCQIFYFWSKFVSFTELSRKQIQFLKIQLCHFLVYVRKLRKSRVDPEKNASRQTDRQTNGQTNSTDFIGPLQQRWRFDHAFQKFENKISWNYLAWLWAIWKRINTRKRNTINIVQCSKSLKTMVLSKFT